MFLCLTLTIAPIGLAILAFVTTTIGAFLSPAYPVDLDTAPVVAPIEAPEAPAVRVSAECRVALYERRAYPLPEIRAAHRTGVRGSVRVRYSGAPSYPSLDVVAF